MRREQPQQEQVIDEAFDRIQDTIDDGDALTGWYDEIKDILRVVWDKAIEHESYRINILENDD